VKSNHKKLSDSLQAKAGSTNVDRLALLDSREIPSACELETIGSIPVG